MDANRTENHCLPKLDIRRLSSGWWHIRADGPCNWTQVPTWPCDEKTIRECSHPEAAEQFLRRVIRSAEIVQEDSNAGE
jgi:hypothetical protein